MVDQVLSEQELDLLVEILEKESQHLAVEIRHTDHREARDLLRNRQQSVDRLIERCREFKAAMSKT